MSSLWEIVQGIPVWVYLVLGYGLFIGVRSFSVRTVPVSRLILLPVVFAGLSLSSLVPVVAKAPLVGAEWGLLLALGVVAGYFFLTGDPLSVDRSRGRLVVPGTPWVLVLFVTIFSVKFVYGYETAVHPDVASEPLMRAVVFGFSGLSTGIIAGRTTRFLMAFYQTWGNEELG